MESVAARLGDARETCLQLSSQDGEVLTQLRSLEERWRRLQLTGDWLDRVEQSVQADALDAESAVFGELTERKQTMRWLVSTLDALVGGLAEPEAERQRQQLSALVMRYKELVPRLETAAVALDGLSQCHNYRIEIDEDRDRRGEVSVMTGLDGLSRCHNYRIEIDERGRDLGRDLAQRPALLPTALARLEQTWAESNAELIQRLDQATDAEKLWSELADRQADLQCAVSGHQAAQASERVEAVRRGLQAAQRSQQRLTTLDMPPEAQGYDAGQFRSELAILGDTLEHMRETAQQQQAVLEEEYAHWQTYQAEVGELVPWLHRAEQKVAAELPRPAQLQEATDMLHQCRQFEDECNDKEPAVKALVDESSQIIQVLVDESSKMVQVFSVSDEADSLVTRWTKVRETSVAWVQQMQGLVSALQEVHTELSAVRQWLDRVGGQLSPDEADQDTPDARQELDLLQPAVTEMPGKQSAVLSLQQREETYRRLEALTGWLDGLKAQLAEFDRVQIDSLWECLTSLASLQQELTAKLPSCDAVREDATSLYNERPSRENARLRDDSEQLKRLGEQLSALTERVQSGSLTVEQVPALQGNLAALQSEQAGLVREAVAVEPAAERAGLTVLRGDEEQPPQQLSAGTLQHLQQLMAQLDEQDQRLALHQESQAVLESEPSRFTEVHEEMVALDRSWNALRQTLAESAARHQTLQDSWTAVLELAAALGSVRSAATAAGLSECLERELEQAKASAREAKCDELKAQMERMLPELESAHILWSQVARVHEDGLRWATSAHQMLQTAGDGASSLRETSARLEQCQHELAGQQSGARAAAQKVADVRRLLAADKLPALDEAQQRLEAKLAATEVALHSASQSVAGLVSRETALRQALGRCAETAIQLRQRVGELDDAAGSPQEVVGRLRQVDECAAQLSALECSLAAVQDDIDAMEQKAVPTSMYQKEHSLVGAKLKNIKAQLKRATTMLGGCLEKNFNLLLKDAKKNHIALTDKLAWLGSAPTENGAAVRSRLDVVAELKEGVQEAEAALTCLQQTAEQYLTALPEEKRPAVAAALQHHERDLTKLAQGVAEAERRTL
ncbi:restin homolog [Pollicipes pollicipes]|uniref:restin homolog n=1 Tax=Pollicipes pollicipes TaxID=41117 RepID=UPI001884A454|nr:restin homolog [Pollicipes pollicipes]